MRQRIKITGVKVGSSSTKGTKPMFIGVVGNGKMEMKTIRFHNCKPYEQDNGIVNSSRNYSRVKLRNELGIKCKNELIWQKKKN